MRRVLAGSLAVTSGVCAALALHRESRDVVHVVLSTAALLLLLAGLLVLVAPPLWQRVRHEWRG